MHSTLHDAGVTYPRYQLRPQLLTRYAWLSPRITPSPEGILPSTEMISHLR